MSDLHLVLLHYPVLDKNGQVVTTAVTNMDVHDIARSARTYGVRRFYVVTPVRALQLLVARILEHWETGFGSTYNATRKVALEIVRVQSDLEEAVVSAERESGARPLLVATSARRQAVPGTTTITHAELREGIASGGRPYMLILGTGWGLAPSVIERADFLLEPIHGVAEYNHLSVRAAAAIMLDRLRGPR